MDDGQPHRREAPGELAALQAEVASLRADNQRLELRFRRLVEALPEPILVHIDRLIAYANPAAARFAGVVDGDALIGRSVLEFATPGTQRLIESRMASGPDGGMATVEQSFVGPDGGEQHVEVRSIPFDYDGRPATLSIARDLTRRIRAEREAAAALRKVDFERQRLGTLLEKAPAFIAVMRGPDHVFELANQACHAIVGPRALIGRPVVEALPELAAQGFVAVLDHVLATGEPFIADAVPVQLANGVDGASALHYVSFVYQPVTEADGTRTGVFLHGVDVTAVTIAQQRVRAQFHGVPVPTYVWQRVERDGAEPFVLIDYNQAALTMSGGRLDDHRGATAATFFDDVPEVIAKLDRCLDDQVTLQHELQREGRRLFITYAAAPPDLVIVHTEDITERTKLEDQLRQTQKMEAVGRLAGGIAHDFNNLLSVILSYSSIALEDLGAGDPLRDDLVEIQRAGERATGLTRQLLAFSRRQILQPRVTDLDQIVAGVTAMLGRLLREDIAVTVRPTPGLGLVLADPGQIEQVLMNLAVNARDAMPDGGRVTIETANVVLDATYAALHPGVAPGAYVMLAVSDTGVGMDAATRSRIFEPFFTTKGPGKGTGLGLSTVLGIVQQAGGHVGVYSEPGHGSAFKVYLPRTERLADAAITGRVEVLPRGVATILLVEDEDQVRQVAATILRRHGYTVLEAANGGDALRIAAEPTTSLDLVVTDVVMPHVGGRKLAELLAVQRPELKVLFTSGYTDDAIVHHGVLDAGVAFLQKPFTPDALLRKVDEVLAAPAPALAPR